MKTAKKLIWVFIAILPILPILFMLVSHLGNNVADVNLPMGEISISKGDGSYYLYYNDNTWSSLMFSAFSKSGFIRPGLFAAITGLCYNLNLYAGIPLSAPFIFGMWYLCYIAIIEILSFAVDFILFVPRKCSEIFR